MLPSYKVPPTKTIPSSENRFGRVSIIIPTLTIKTFKINYNPRNLIPIPLKKIAAPARAWA